MIRRKVGQMVCLQGSRRYDNTLNGGGDCPGPGGPQIAAIYGGGDCPGPGTPQAINGFHSKDSKKISPA
jgi:hypothetical protein